MGRASGPFFWLVLPLMTAAGFLSRFSSSLLSARITSFGDVPAEAAVARVMVLLPRMKEGQPDQARIQDHPIRDLNSGTDRVAADALV